MVKKKLEQDPLRDFKRLLAKEVRGKSPKEKLDIYLRHGLEQKGKRDLTEGGYDYIRGKVQVLLRQLKLGRYVTTDGQVETWLEPYLSLRSKEEAEMFRRFIARKLGGAVARTAVIEETAYKVNPELMKHLDACGLKEEYCRRQRKLRLQLRATTTATKKGER